MSVLEVDPPDKLKAAKQLVQTSDGAWPGVTSAREAWETIAPTDWVGASHRRFERGGESPASVADAVAIGCDPVGIAAAEALARQFASEAGRLLKLDPPTEVVGWRVVDPRRFRARFCAQSAGQTGHALFRALCAEHKIESAAVQRMNISADLLAPLQDLQVSAMRQWGPVALDLVALLKWHDLTCTLKLDSPFESLVSLWECGYALDELVHGRAILVAPPV